MFEFKQQHFSEIGAISANGERSKMDWYGPLMTVLVKSSNVNQLQISLNAWGLRYFPCELQRSITEA